MTANKEVHDLAVEGYLAKDIEATMRDIRECSPDVNPIYEVVSSEHANNGVLTGFSVAPVNNARGEIGVSVFLLRQIPNGSGQDTYGAHSWLKAEDVHKLIDALQRSVELIEKPK